MSKLSQLDRQDIINALAEGVSSGVLGRKYGVNRSSIIAVKKQNIGLIQQRLNLAKEYKEQAYFTALKKLKIRIDTEENIPILTLIAILRELNNQIQPDQSDASHKDNNVDKYKRLSGGEIEQKIKGLLAEYKHIKKLDDVVVAKPTE
jgi:hypothetical protein